MKLKLDETDRAIIDILQIDGRMSNAEIARSIGGISIRTVGFRIKRLIREEVIKVKAVVNREPLGYSVLADIFIDVEPGKVTEIAKVLCTMEELSYVGIVTGDSDLSIQVQQPSIKSLQDFVINKLHSIPGVRKTKTYIIAECLRLSHDWRVPEKIFTQST
jgi:Lrp/AsnC family transcriptional regulator, regulator for asnA, asnC and gidA